MSDSQTPHSGLTPPANAKADAKASKAYAKASRNWYQKKRWWAAGALALIIIGGGMSDGGETADDQQPVAAGANAESEPSEQPVEEAAVEPVDEEEKAQEPAPAPKPKAKAIKVEATKIVKEFEENELAADAKYKGKDLLITGRIDKIDTELWDDEKYVLRLGGKWDFLSVNCYGMSTEELATLKTGETVTVRGTFDDGGDLGVEVKDCSLA
jgi:hypothetical protein